MANKKRGRWISATLGSSRKYRRLGLCGKDLGEFAQVLFVLILANTDSYGHFKADAESLQLEIFPGSVRSEVDFETAITLMKEVELIQLYEAEGERYLEVQNFEEHQAGLHPRGSMKRGKPKYPLPASAVAAVGNTDYSKNAVGATGIPPSSSSLKEKNSSHDLERRGEEEKKKKAPSTSTMTDDEYLDHLQAKTCYAHLNVRFVYGKMVTWCELRHKQPSRARLVNWLNREEPPMVGRLQNGRGPNDRIVGEAGVTPGKYDHLAK